jgi:hypothetical protein
VDDPANSMGANMRRVGEFCKPAGARFLLTIYISRYADLPAGQSGLPGHPDSGHSPSGAPCQSMS